MASNRDNEHLTKREREELLARRKMRKLVLGAVGAAVVFIGIVALIYFLNGNGTAGKGAAATAEPTAEPAATGVAASTAEPAATGGTGVTQNADYARADDPVATIALEDGREIVIELYPAAAPNTVANFVTLANAGFYNGLIFHRVISGFMIQGGDPNGNGTGGPGYAIEGEFTENGVDNRLTHTRGVISMARSSVGYDTAGSQFFIMHADAASLDGQYAAFGAVTGGMDVVDEIASVETGAGDKPVEDVVIRSIRVDAKGIDYQVTKIED